MNATALKSTGIQSQTAIHQRANARSGFSKQSGWRRMGCLLCLVWAANNADRTNVC